MTKNPFKIINSGISFHISDGDFQINYRDQAYRRRLRPIPNKPSTLRLPHSNARWPELNPSPTVVSSHCVAHNDCVMNIRILKLIKLCLQFYQPSHPLITTPQSVQSFPHAPNATFTIHNQGSSLDDTIIGYHFHDRERELIERQIAFERELDNERFVLARE